MLNIEGLNDHELNMIAAALTVAAKGKLCMHAPCPRCGVAKRLHEKILAGGAIRHECVSCGYLAVWKPRRAKALHEQPSFPGMKPYVKEWSA